MNGLDVLLGLLGIAVILFVAVGIFIIDQSDKRP